MYRHLGLHRMPLRPARITGSTGRRTRHSPSKGSSAIGFVSAIVLVTVGMVVGIALIATAPATVTLPIATVLGLGLIASVLVAVSDRWFALRRSTERNRR